MRSKGKLNGWQASWGESMGQGAECRHSVYHEWMSMETFELITLFHLHVGKSLLLSWNFVWVKWWLKMTETEAWVEGSTLPPAVCRRKGHDALEHWRRRDPATIRMRLLSSLHIEILLTQMWFKRRITPISKHYRRFIFFSPLKFLFFKPRLSSKFSKTFHPHLQT